MKPIKILYDIQHFEIEWIVKNKIEKIESKRNIKIKMDIIGGYELISKLKSNPNCNFVIIHMGQNGEGAYRQADTCSKLTNAILVGESSIYPIGAKESLNHFHEYIRLISIENNLEDLLSKYGFISEV